MSDYKFMVTEAAGTAIKEALEKRGTPDAYLQVGVRGGKCSGLSYHLEYVDSEPNDKFHVFTYDGFSIIIDKKSILYLNGTTLDWKESLLRQGFDFTNPLSINKCGCGQSFFV